MTNSQLPSKERLEQYIRNPLECGMTRSEVMELARGMLAGMEQEPVGLFYEAEQGNWYQQSPGDKAPKWTPLYAAPVVSEQPDYKAAIATLEHFGYTYHGGKMWKPPLGPAPNFSLIDQLHAEIDALKEQLGSYLAPVAVPAPVTTSFRDGIEAAAKWIDTQREAFDNEHGRVDLDTGMFEFGNDAQLEYSGTLAELAEGIRALHPNTGNSQVMPDYEGTTMTQRECYQAGLEAGKALAPDGWKLVPIEPTESMIVDGFESEPDESFSKPDAWEEYQSMSGCRQAAHRARLCWAAMLAASPKPDGV